LVDMGCWEFRWCKRAKRNLRKSVFDDRFRDKRAEKNDDENESKQEVTYNTLIKKLLRRPDTTPTVEIATSPLPRKTAPATERGTIVEEPILEKMCEMSEIEPNHLLYNVMTKSERRSLVNQFGTNHNTARVFQNEETLKKFMDEATDAHEDNVSRNTIAVGFTTRPVSISSVSTNKMAGRRMGAPDRWESIRQSIRESRKVESRRTRQSQFIEVHHRNSHFHPRMSTATRKSTSEATFKNVIEDIVKHRESQLRLKRLLIENTFDSDELENSSHDVFNT